MNSNIMSRVFEPTLHFYILNSPLLDNYYGTIIPQALLKLVLPNISLNMNV
jgi:hypothetical protein